MIVATAGHIDHGKSTLVRALSGVDTDKLPEEKARGISIDIGFAYWTPPSSNEIGFVDVPGHERFIRNMLAGVCAIDFALLVVAADDGVMPQTIEHLNILDLLGIKQGLVVLNKIDRVLPQRAQEVIQQTRHLLANTGLADIDILPVSALTGQGVDTVRDVLTQKASEQKKEQQQGRLFRFAVDRSFTVAGNGTVVTGTIFNDQVKIGDRLTVTPNGQSVRVRGIQQNGRQVDTAQAGSRCALNIAGVTLEQCARGDWIVHPLLHQPTQRLDVKLRVLATEKHALKHWTPIHFHLGTAVSTGRIAIKRGATINPGERGFAQIFLDKPLAALHNDRFIIRDQSAIRTLGGGHIIDPFTPIQKSRTIARQQQLIALDNVKPVNALAELVQCTPNGVDLNLMQRSLNFNEAYMNELIEQQQIETLGKEIKFGFSKFYLSNQKQKIFTTIEHFHAAKPQALGITIQSLHKQIDSRLSADIFFLLLKSLSEQGKLNLSATTAALPSHRATSNSIDEVMWQKLEPVIKLSGIKPPTVTELAETTKLKKALIEDLLHRKAKSGETFRINSDRFYARTTFAMFASLASELSKKNEDQQFTAAEFRDLSGLNRNIAIEVLEALDRLGVTQRLGNKRRVLKLLSTEPSQ
jgi:selenocysteine-specific elongation factor